jgi:hypothetical protein
MGSAQDRKIKGGVEIKRGTVDVAAPLASAQEHACGLGLAPTIFTFLLLAILVQYNG